MQPPPKPRPDFPLFASRNGQWRKDIRLQGKVRPFYFGPWADDPEGTLALREWLDRKDAIYAGLDHTGVRRADESPTVASILRRFLEWKQQELKDHNTSPHTFGAYIRECKLFGEWAGGTARVSALTPDHFGAYRKYLEQDLKLGVDRVAIAIKLLRAVFHHADEQTWCLCPKFGSAFAVPNTKPGAKAMRKIRKGEHVARRRTYTGAVVDWLVANTPPLYGAAVLMGLNCGMGPSDLARLRWANIQGKRMTMLRGKNAIERECYLWKRTREALDKLRTLPHQAAALLKDGDQAFVFLNRTGKPLTGTTEKRSADGEKIEKIIANTNFSTTFGRYVQAARDAGVIPADAELVFYDLRRTFYTHAENCPDLNAVHRCMGHTLVGMGDTYKQQPFPLPRLKVVALKVKRSVWPKPKRPPMMKLAV
jgi:integrase